MTKVYDRYKWAMENDAKANEYYSQFKELEDMGLMEKVIDRINGRDQVLWVATEKGNRIAKLLNHIGAR